MRQSNIYSLYIIIWLSFLKVWGTIMSSRIIEYLLPCKYEKLLPLKKQDDITPVSLQYSGACLLEPRIKHESIQDVSGSGVGRDRLIKHPVITLGMCVRLMRAEHVTLYRVGWPWRAGYSSTWLLTNFWSCLRYLVSRVVYASHKVGLECRSVLKL